MYRTSCKYIKIKIIRYSVCTHPKMQPFEVTTLDRELVNAHKTSIEAQTKSPLNTAEPVQIDMAFDFFKERLTNGVTTYEGDWIIESIPERQRNIDEMGLVYKEYESKCPLVITHDLQEKKIITSDGWLGGSNTTVFDADPNVLSRFILQSVPKSKDQNNVNVSK